MVLHTRHHLHVDNRPFGPCFQRHVWLQLLAWPIEIQRSVFMTRSDLIAVIITCLYAVLLVGTSEFIQRQFHFPYEFTRKVVHIGTGMWLWAVLVFFDHWQVAVILFAAFT